MLGIDIRPYQRDIGFVDLPEPLHSMEKVPPLVLPATLFDIPALLGVEVLPERYSIIVVEGRESPVPCVGVRQVEGEEEAAAAGVGDLVRKEPLELVESREKMRPDLLRVVEKTVLLDHLDDPLAAHHVDEVAAPGRVDPRRDLEHGVDLLDSWPGCQTANLRLLGE